MAARFQLALAAVVAGLAFAAPGSAASPTLNITYDAGTVTITLPDGTPVGGTSAPGTVIPPGTYNLVFNIVSGSPSILIVGPGVSVGFNEPEDFAITRTFAPNSTYTFQNLAPASPVMVFSTSAAPAVSTPATTTTPAGPTVSNTSPIGADIGNGAILKVELDASGRLRFTRAGKPVTRLAAGSYRIALDDRERTRGVELRKQAGSTLTLTSRLFVGSRSLSVELSRGRWVLSSGATGSIGFTVT